MKRQWAKRWVHSIAPSIWWATRSCFLHFRAGTKACFWQWALCPHPQLQRAPLRVHRHTCDSALACTVAGDPYNLLRWGGQDLSLFVKVPSTSSTYFTLAFVLFPPPRCLGLWGAGTCPSHRAAKWRGPCVNPRQFGFRVQALNDSAGLPACSLPKLLCSVCLIYEGNPFFVFSWSSLMIWRREESPTSVL